MPEKYVRNLEATRSNLTHIITPQINVKYCVFNSWVILLLITLWKPISATAAVAGLAAGTLQGGSCCCWGQSGKVHPQPQSRRGHCWAPVPWGVTTPHLTQQQDTHRRLLQQRGKPSLRTDKCRDNLNPPSIGVISADGVDPIRLCISVRVVWWNLGKIQELRKQPEEWKSVFFWSFSDTYWKPKKSTQIPLKLIP